MTYKLERYPQPGDAVIYVDPTGKEHAALVTAGWSAATINVVVVSQDKTKTDNYGRQVERPTSVGVWTEFSAHGNYWRWPEQTEAATYKQAAEVAKLPPY